jgi:hypothetical protein
MSQRIINSCLPPIAGFLRVSKLLYVKRSDIIFESCYASIFIPKSKTDIFRDGNTVVRGGSRGCAPPPLKFSHEKTQKFSRLLRLGAIFYVRSPPNLKSWIRPWL